MAIAGTVIFQVWSTGADTNGGGFVGGTTGTTDYSQQATPVLALTDGVANGTTTITSAAGGFTAAMVNNCAYIGGRIYQITAVGSSTSITVDQTVATASALAINVGGALATIGMAGAAQVPGCVIYWKVGTYGFTNATNNVSGGFFACTGSPVTIWGFDVTPGDNTGNRPICNAAAYPSDTVIALDNGIGSVINNVSLEGGTGTNILVRGGGGKAINCTTSGGTIFIGQNCSTAIDCFASGNGTIVNSNGTLIGCVWVASGASWGGGIFDRCIVVGGRFDLRSESSISLLNCISYGDSSGFSCLVAGGSQFVRNCIFATTYSSEVGVGGGGNANNTILENNAFFGMTTDISTGVLGPSGVASGTVHCTVNPFVNPTATINSWADAQAAFALNNTAGGGALCRGAGTPQYLDIGATQHQDSGGGGVPRIVVPRRMW